MVARPFVKSQKNITKILTIQPQFYTQMADLYSVTARTVRVITIYHQAINPERIKGFAK